MRFTLTADGASDEALIPVLTWLLRQAGVNADLQPQWADLRNLRKQPANLGERLRLVVKFYACDLLFVHRDAEKESPEKRISEITEAIDEVSKEIVKVPYICVIPVRMQEAWLLFNEKAIRAAAGNPNGKVPLNLPRISDLEGLPNPKAILFELLSVASGLNRRRLKRFSVFHARKMVAEHIDDFSPLRQLPAFASLESDVNDMVQESDWK